MASQVFGLVDGQAQNLGGNFGVLVKGELGAEGDGFGNPWPKPRTGCCAAVRPGEYCWCVYSMTADEEETQCVLLLFRGLDKESFDSCSDEAGETHAGPDLAAAQQGVRSDPRGQQAVHAERF